jgi:hypothetical protein
MVREKYSKRRKRQIKVVAKMEIPSKDLRVKRKIPYLGIIGIIFSIYFILEPDLQTDGQFTAEGPESMYTEDKKVYSRVTMTFPITNHSIRPGYINKIELLPYGLSATRYKIFNVEIDKDYIYWKQTKNIKIRFSVLQENLNYNRDNWESGDTNYRGQALSLALFDNFESPILYELNKNISYTVFSSYFAEDSSKVFKNVDPIIFP